MTHLLAPRGADTVTFLRRALVALTVIGILATAFELASERHWSSIEQLIPWAALVVLAAATALALLPDGRGTTAARVLAVVVLGASVYGVIEHILTNYGAGALDQRYADVWDTLPLVERAWYAITRTVGPAPTLAPGVLGQTALLLILATFCRSGSPRGRAG